MSMPCGVCWYCAAVNSDVLWMSSWDWLIRMPALHCTAAQCYWLTACYINAELYLRPCRHRQGTVGSWGQWTLTFHSGSSNDAWLPTFHAEIDSSTSLGDNQRKCHYFCMTFHFNQVNWHYWKTYKTMRANFVPLLTSETWKVLALGALPRLTYVFESLLGVHMYPAQGFALRLQL